MVIKTQLGEKIKRLRKQEGMTQEQLAEKLQIATRTLCGIENGENFVTSETLEKIINVFNISLSDIFAFDHLKPQDELKNEIISDIEKLTNREKIETIYKTVKAIISV